MPEQKPSTVSITYEQVEGRPSIPVGGAYGGPTPDGSMVVAHIYSEFVTVPSLDELEVGPDGVAKAGEGHQIKRSDLTRKVLATLVMAPEVALSLGTWLAGNGQMALEHRQRKGTK